MHPPIVDWSTFATRLWSIEVASLFHPHPILLTCCLHLSLVYYCYALAWQSSLEKISLGLIGLLLTWQHCWKASWLHQYHSTAWVCADLAAFCRSQSFFISSEFLPRLLKDLKLSNSSCVCRWVWFLLEPCQFCGLGRSSLTCACLLFLLFHPDISGVLYVQH